MERAIRETERRRAIQMKYNEEHGIIPKTISKSVREIIEISKKDTVDSKKKRYSKKEREDLIAQLTKEMKAAAKILEFEHAAALRDRIEELKKAR